MSGPWPHAVWPSVAWPDAVWPGVGISPALEYVPTEFNPLQVANILSWLDDLGFYQDLDATIPATQFGDPVRYWQDQSGNNNPAVLSGTPPTTTSNGPFPHAMFPNPLFPNALFPGSLSGGITPILHGGGMFPGTMFPSPMFPDALFPGSSLSPATPINPLIQTSSSSNGPFPHSLFSNALFPNPLFPGQGVSSAPTGNPPIYAPGTVQGHNAISSTSGEFLTILGIFPQPVTIYMALLITDWGEHQQLFVGDDTKNAGINLNRFYFPTANPFNSVDQAARIFQLTFNGGSSTYAIDGLPAGTSVVATTSFSGIQIGVFVDPLASLQIRIAEVAVYSAVPSPQDNVNLQNYFLNKYSRLSYETVMTQIRSLIQTSTSFTTPDVAMSMWPEPYPLGGGPACFLMPNKHVFKPPQAMGAGRYAYGMEGTITARIIGLSFLDMAYDDTLRLTDHSLGILDRVHEVINATNYQFLLDPNGLSVTEEPLIVAGQTTPRTYKRNKGAGEWSYVDLIYKVNYAARTFTALADETETLPVASRLSDVLIGIQNELLSRSIFNPDQISISLSEERFQISESPSCYIKPNNFVFSQPETYGAGQYYSVANGSVSIVITQSNRMDLAGRSDQMLANFIPAFGLLTRAAAVVDRMQLCFPVNDEGAPVTVGPIYVTGISEPRYFGQSGSQALVSIDFNVRYQQLLS